MTVLKIILRFIYGFFMLIVGAAGTGLHIQDWTDKGFSWVTLFFIAAGLGCSAYGLQKIEKSIK